MKATMPKKPRVATEKKNWAEKKQENLPETNIAAS